LIYIDKFSANPDTHQRTRQYGMRLEDAT